MKYAVGEFPPLLLTALRFALAAVPLVFFIARPAIGWRPLIAFGVAFGIVKFGLLFVAFKVGMPAGLAALVLQTQAFFTVILAVIALNERPPAMQWGGIALALLGVAIVAATGSPGPTALPLALTLAAAIAWASANIVMKQAGPVDMLSFTVWMSLVPPLPMLALSLIFEGPAAIAQSITGASLTGLAALAYLAYPISVVSTALWGWLLTRHSAASVTPFALLVPIIGMLAGAVVFGETLSTSTVGGAIFIGLGLLVSLAAAHSQKATRPA